MNNAKKMIRYLKDADYRFLINANRGKYNTMPDREYLERMFRAKMGYELDFEHPKTFNEKLQWLKLHDRQPVYTTMVDKYDVKKYISDIIGENYIIPTLGIWQSVYDIDFNQLPDQFVLKCTHDSQGLAICKDRSRFSVQQSVERIAAAMKRNYYYKYREWPYKNVVPRVLAETYMEDEYGEGLCDYKVLCFHGVPKLIEFHQGRFTDHQTQDFYDVNWRKMPISQSGISNFQVSSDVVPKPDVLDEMLNLSSRLSDKIPHIRVDWYIINGRLYFGELTFFDGAGFDPFDRYEDDLLLGSWIHL